MAKTKKIEKNEEEPIVFPDAVNDDDAEEETEVKEENVKEESVHKKGDMLGCFKFGGSDFIMLFQKKAGFEIMAQQNEDRKTYKHNLMGVKYGVMRWQAE